MPPLATALAGKRLLLTGATGFVGEALLERILTELADTTVVLVVRRRGSQSAQDRVAALLRKPAFAKLREALGDDAALDALQADRITVVDADLASELPRLPADIDIAIHCAGEVSFDPAIDEGFETNVFGSLRLLDALAASGSRAHYVHISTAYVSGRRLGPVPEGRLDHSVDWRAEADAAAGLRAVAEAESRSPDRLAEFQRAATREHSASGPLTISAEAEKARVTWVRDRLVDAGRERARTLGWTDCYTFTKAMAERAVEQAATELPVTVVRPSIIESALTTPYPGWIEGFKMAEPLILAFGRGDLPEFPGNADGIIDIIPVDLVVNAILAAAAARPEPGSPTYFTVCSGARNPFRFHDLYTLVRDHFTEQPVDKQGLGAVRLPTWQWPGQARIERLLGLGERLHRATDRAVAALPRSERTRSWSRSLDRRARQLQFLRRYLDLYQPYVAGEVRFTDAATLALHNDLHPGDRERFGFDAAVIDWKHYIGEVHVPTVTAPLRAHAAASRPRPTPTRAIPRPTADADRIVAVFDMDGTLLDSNVVLSYLWLRLPELSPAERGRELLRTARSLPGWLANERTDRGAFLRSIYQRYAGADPTVLDRIVDAELSGTLLSRLSPGAVRAARQHRAAGHRVVLVTGAIRALTRPIAPLFDEIVAADLMVDETGRATGHLDLPPLVGESRGAWLRHRAAEAGWDLPASYAYADSATDLPMLRAVGHPIVVDPDVALARAARKHAWPVELWRAAAS